VKIWHKILLDLVAKAFREIIVFVLVVSGGKPDISAI